MAGSGRKATRMTPEKPGAASCVTLDMDRWIGADA